MVNSLSVGSSGYVVDTFVAAMWCLLTTDNYRDCVLKAVNLGSDTDTTAAVAGGLAGIMYGLEGIPDEVNGHDRSRIIFFAPIIAIPRL